MRKECRQTYETVSLVQKLNRGGWRKRAKKAIAGVLATAMVLTSGVVMPQNTKTAEAATEINVGTDNGDGTYTLEWWNYANFYGEQVSEGDFSVSYSFHNASAGLENYQNFAVALVTDLERTSESAEDWYMRADTWNNDTFDGSTVTFDYGTINWDTFKSILKDSNVTVSVAREGTTITISCSASDVEGNTVTWGATATSCPTSALKIYLGGESCKLSAPKSIHTVTVNYKYATNSTEAANSVTKKVFEGNNYSIASPDIEGYAADKPVVTETMGASDVTVDVTYTSTSSHNVNVKYVYADGSEAKETVTKARDEGKAYSIASPVIEGYAADKTTVVGTMGTEDVNVTVTYKKVIATIGSDAYDMPWSDYTNFYKVLKKAGDFNVSFTFHNDSAGVIWNNFAVAVTTDLASTGATWLGNAKEWYVRGDNFSSATFLGSTVTQNGDIPTVDTLKDSEVTVSIARTDTTISIGVSGVGADGKNFSYGSTAENCPTDMAAIYLGGDACKLSVYDATASDSFEKSSVTVHYVYEDGKKAADDVVKEDEEGTTYAIESPVISGYQASANVVNGVIGSESKEITVTYRKYVATVGSVSADGTYGGVWNDISAGCGVQKVGDFDITFRFHNESAGSNGWDNYGVSLTTNLKATAATYNENKTDWFLRGDRWNNDTFEGSTVVYEDSEINWDTFAATLKDADVTVNVNRTGNTIVISNSVAGANGLSFSWKAICTDAPTADMAVTLTSSLSRLVVYEAPVPDVIFPRSLPVDVHYVYEDGSKAADDAKTIYVQEGSKYSIESPVIEGYTPDLAVVAGTMGSKAVEVTVTYRSDSKPAVATIGQDNGDGTYSLGWQDYANFYGTAVKGDFTISYQFHNTSAGALNWEGFNVSLTTNLSATSQAAGDWNMRADRWNNSTFAGTEPVVIDDTIDWGTFLSIMKDCDASVTVTRQGSTITISTSAVGTNGEGFTCGWTAKNCPTDDLMVYLGGENCLITINNVTVNGSDTPAEPTDEPSEPTDEPAEPTDTPAEPTDTPAEPTDEPSEPTAEPTKAPVIEKGDKVTKSNITYKVTSTKSKTVTYTAVKGNKKSVTVPNTVKLTSNGKTVTYKVTAISKDTFKNDKKLEKIVIGENITKIDASAFKNCKNLTTIVIKSKKITSVGKDVLSGTNKKLVIKVPASKVAAYKKLFASKGNKNVVVKKA